MKLAVAWLGGDGEALPDIEEIGAGGIVRVAHDAAEVLAAFGVSEPPFGDLDELGFLAAWNADFLVFEHGFEIGERDEADIMALKARVVALGFGDACAAADDGKGERAIELGERLLFGDVGADIDNGHGQNPTKARVWAA